MYFYPILVRHEAESWAAFPEALARLLDGSYGPYGAQKAQAFLDNLSGKA